MCKEIKEELIKHNFLYSYRVTDVKEKYGTLRWYDSGYVGNIDKIISKYEDLSMCYCQYCGKPSKYYSKGWISYICENCRDKLVKEGKYKENYILLKKSDIPSHVKYESGKLADEYTFNEVKELADKNWSD